MSVSAVVAAKAGYRREQKRQRRREVTFSYLLLAPYLLLLLMFGVVPVAYALGLSFFDTYDMVFWGLENYRFVFGDFRLGQSFVNVATYLSIWLTATVVCVTMLSLMLDTLRQGVANTIRTLYFLPGAVTSSAVVVLWIFMLDPAVSPFGGAYGALGWDTRAVVVSSLGFAGIFAVMAFFASSGGWIVVFGGALSSLSPEVIEAARVDGARPMQLALRIKLPMIWRSVVLMAVLSFAVGLQLFVEPQLISLAGEQFAQKDWAPNQLAFQYAFAMGDFGASAALSSLLLGVCVAIALTIIFATDFYEIR